MSLRRNCQRPNRAGGVCNDGTIFSWRHGSLSSSMDDWDGVQSWAEKGGPAIPEIRDQSNAGGVFSGLNVKRSSEEVTGSGTDVIRKGSVRPVSRRRPEINFRQLTLTEPVGYGRPLKPRRSL
jgi:hypothetical protein